MEQILSIPIFDGLLKEYADSRDLRNFYEKYGCSGLEIIRCDNSDDDGAAGVGTSSGKVDTGSEKIERSMVRGVHMLFYSAWMDFWRQNKAALRQEYGDRATWEKFYRCGTPDGLIQQFEADLDYAQRVGAAYVVFHVSEVTLEGVFTHCYSYSDAEVIDEAVELINRLLDGKHYTFDFLMENLWWPGLNMTDPQMTKRLLQGVHYPKKGIMLDLGHFMCSNMELSTEQEAIEYVHEMLDAHDRDTLDGRPLTEYIQGVHVHQSVSGAYAGQALTDVRQNGLHLAEDFFQRFAQAYQLLGHIDTHKPFSSPLLKPLLARIAPKYAVHELSAANRAEREAMLAQQSGLLRENF